MAKTKMKEQSVPRSFRIDNDVIKILTRIAEDSDVTLNLLVSNILKEYALTRHNLNKFGTITLSRNTFMILLNGINEKKIAEIAESAATNFLEFANQLLLPSGFPSFRHILKRYLCEGCGWANYYEVNSQENDYIVLTHNYGETFSTFLKYYVNRVLTEFRMGVPLDDIKTHRTCITIPFPPKVLARMHPITAFLERTGEEAGIENVPL